MPNTYLWRLPQWAEDRFIELADNLDGLDRECDEAYALRDEIRSLPGHPLNTTEFDLILREITTIKVN